MVQPGSKKKLLSVLVLAFVVQTALVYGDVREDPISDAAVRGRQLWHDNACQVCHQVYGNGGFLGPDVTNAASRVDDTRLTMLLTVGSGQMPAFDMTPDEISDMRAYLESLDRPDLGRGQLRLGDPDAGAAPWDRFRAAQAEVMPRSETAAWLGAEAFDTRVCSTCHLPLEASATTRAPDLSLALSRISEEELRTVLIDGRIEGGMPPPVPALSPEEVDGLVEWIRWQMENREELEAAMVRGPGRAPVRWRDIPWWEY